MISVLKGLKDQIVSEINSFFRDIRSVPMIDDFWFYESLDRLHEFVLSGKMLRGAMVLFSEKMFSGNYSKDGLRCAITVELLQSGLLIHDDIMDEDTQRRGKDTIFYQYKKLADKESASNSHHIGESMGICAGNFAFSLAFLSLANISKKNVMNKLILKFGEEMAIVGIGQMKDVITSGVKRVPTEEEVLSIYKYKTARYSFSLPFSLGAIISEVNSDTIKMIEEIGEYLGVIFQIQDDKIGLVEDSKVTGKPRGSDIKENKKTIFYVKLMNKSNDEDKKKLIGIFGNPDISDNDINTVIDLCYKYNIFDDVNRLLEKYSEIAREKISYLPVSREYKDHLFEFIDYNLTRDR
ncbi:MAG: polyprenyl synthetase family protein [Brevinematales bacterium]|nr:polyprenyl synthetase family protein [Brevinematales bacterium]